MITMFSVDVIIIKVIENSFILFVLKFHDFRHDGLGVIEFTSWLSCSVCALDKFQNC